MNSIFPTLLVKFETTVQNKSITAYKLKNDIKEIIIFRYTKPNNKTFTINILMLRKLYFSMLTFIFFVFKSNTSMLLKRLKNFLLKTIAKIFIKN
jgi:ABC-type enterochelin transport system permease subunit